MLLQDFVKKFLKRKIFQKIVTGCFQLNSKKVFLGKTTSPSPKVDIKKFHVKPG